MNRFSRRSFLVIASGGVALGCKAPESPASAPSSESDVGHSGTAFAAVSEPKSERDEVAWIHSWVSAQQLVELRNHPPEPGLSGASLRQRLLLTLGGSQLRITLSNEYGNGPLVIESAHVALPGVAHALTGGSSRAVRFDGEDIVRIAPGETATSDPVDFQVPAGTELAVTLRLGQVPSDLSGHPGSRTTSFIDQKASGDALEMNDPQTTDHWYFLSGVEVLTDDDARAVVILGDSITDGRGSTTNENDRYPNVLAKRLLERTSGRPVAVLNQGIGGNHVLEGGLGPTVLERYARDALDLPGVKWVVLFAGINDLGALHGKKPGQEGPEASDLIDAFRRVARAAHERDIRVYGVTLLPFEGSFYFTPEGERHRQTFNDWLRRSELIDAVIDLDQVTRHEDNPTRLRDEIDGGDHLHPSARGYAIMGEAFDLDLFR